MEGMGGEEAQGCCQNRVAESLNICSLKGRNMPEKNQSCLFVFALLSVCTPLALRLQQISQSLTPEGPISLLASLGENRLGFLAE